MPADQHDTFSNQDLIEVLGFTPSTFRCLRNAAIFTIQDLIIAHNKGELRLIKGLDGLNITEITDTLYRAKINFDSSEVTNHQKTDSPIAQQKSEFRPAYYDDLIEELELSRRVYNSLKRVGVNKIGSIMSLIETDALLSIRNLGEKGEIEIKEAINNYSKQNYPGLPAQNEISKPQVVEELPSFTEILHFIDSLSLNFLRVDLSDDVVEKLLSINIKKIGDLSKITHNLANFLTPNSQILDKAINSAKHIIKNRISNGSIHPKVILNDQLIVKFLNRSLTTNVQKTLFLDMANRVFKFPTLDQEISSILENIPSRNLRVFLSYSLEDTTYDEISEVLEVTRERIRQICNVTIRQINRSLIGNPLINLQSSCLFADDLGDELSLLAWRSFLLSKQIYSNECIFEGYSSFEVMCAILKNENIRKHNLPISPSIALILSCDSDLSVREINALSGVSSVNKREILKIIKYTGGVNISNAAQILGSSISDSKFILSSLGLSEIESDWFSFSKAILPKQFPLRTGAYVLMEACGPLPFEVFCDGVRRYIGRHFPSLAPKELIKHVLLLAGFSINNDFVSLSESVHGYLSDSEILFLKLIREKGPVVSFPEIIDFYIENGFSSATASSRIMGQSAIVERIDTGFYTLRGLKYTSQDLETTRSRQGVYLKDPLVTYGLDGLTRYQITIGSWSLGGTLSVCRSCLPIPDLSDGWDAFIDNSPEKFGKIIRDDNLIWGLGPVFNALNIKLGDRVELVFDTWSTPKVTVRVIDAK